MIDDKQAALLKTKMSSDSFRKLSAIENAEAIAFVVHAIELCDPDSVWVGDDTAQDSAYCRELAVKNSEELALESEGHTVHFDGTEDQGREKKVTKYLVPADTTLDSKLNQMPREEGPGRDRIATSGAPTAGRQMLVRFFCLGPIGTQFAIPCLQITDSAYVVHSEDLLYRKGYSAFVDLTEDTEFFKYRHCTGRY